MSVLDGEEMITVSGGMLCLGDHVGGIQNISCDPLDGTHWESIQKHIINHAVRVAKMPRKPLNERDWHEVYLDYLEDKNFREVYHDYLKCSSPESTRSFIKRIRKETKNSLSLKFKESKEFRENGAEVVRMKLNSPLFDCERYSVGENYDLRFGRHKYSNRDSELGHFYALRSGYIENGRKRQKPTMDDYESMQEAWRFGERYDRRWGMHVYSP